MSSAKWRLFYLDLNVLKNISSLIPVRLWVAAEVTNSLQKTTRVQNIYTKYICIYLCFFV